MKKLLVITGLLLAPHQKAENTKNIPTIAVSVCITAVSVLSVQKGYEWYRQTAEKKRGDQLYEELQAEYADELAALRAEQLRKKKLLEIIQNKNNANDPYPVRPYCHALNAHIEQLQKSVFLKKDAEAKQLLDELQQLQTIKNKTLQREYETAQKEYSKEQFENEKKNIQLEKLRYEKEAAHQHYQNERQCSDMLMNIDSKFRSMLAQLQNQTNPIGEIREIIRDLVFFVSQRLHQVEAKQTHIKNDLHTIKEQGKTIGKLKQEISALHQEQKEHNAMLGIINAKLDSVSTQNDPAYAHASAPPL